MTDPALRSLLAQAFEAGHYAWPSPDHPTRASLRDAAIDTILAAAPVPCAASPADPQTWIARCGERFPNYAAMCEHNVRCERCFFVPSIVEVRATGEGARDAVTGLPAGPVPPVAPVEESASESLVLEWARANGLSISQLAELCARLRGEATVRPSGLLERPNADTHVEQAAQDCLDDLVDDYVDECLTDDAYDNIKRIMRLRIRQAIEHIEKYAPATVRVEE